MEKPEFGLKRTDFIRALRVHLLQEYKQNHIHPKVFSDVIERTLDVNEDGYVTEEEWRNFVYRFGPLSDCFDKAKSACVLYVSFSVYPTLSSVLLGFSLRRMLSRCDCDCRSNASNFKLAEAAAAGWYTHYDRDIAVGIC